MLATPTTHAGLDSPARSYGSWRKHGPPAPIPAASRPIAPPSPIAPWLMPPR